MKKLNKSYWMRKISRLARNAAKGLHPFEDAETYHAGADFDFERARAEAQQSGGDFAKLFWSHTGRWADKWPHYFPIYDECFGPYRRGFPQAGGSLRPLKFLEIGVSHGGSLQIWRQFFGPAATIFGVDIDPRCASVADPTEQVRIGSQDDPEFLHKVIDEMGGVDVILEDGSHIANHQEASFDILFPLLPAGGLYVVEDTQTAYWRPWKGGHRRPGTFIEVSKSVIDDMHARYHGSGATRPFADHDVQSVAFFDGMIAFKKGQRPPSFRVQVGTRSF